MNQKVIIAALFAASSMGLAGGMWNSVQAEEMQAEETTVAPAENDAPQNGGRGRGMRNGARGGLNGGQRPEGGRGGWNRGGGQGGMRVQDATTESNRLANQMARDFNKPLTEAQKTQLKAAIETRNAAVKAAQENFQRSMTQITGVTQQELNAKRQERFRNGGPRPGGAPRQGSPQAPQQDDAPEAE